MQILILLGLVIIGASIALVYMGKSADDKEKSFISKILKNVSAGGRPMENEDVPTSKTEKYEKSPDGKVVYIFKNKEEKPEDEDDDKDDDDSEDDIEVVDAEIVEDVDESEDE